MVNELKKMYYTYTLRFDMRFTILITIKKMSNLFKGVKLAPLVLVCQEGI